MGSCIICGIPVDGGHVCDSHQEDVLFEFSGNHASQLIDNRFYQGTVDGYADFGVFIDLAPGVTGLLHRSELDRRLDPGWDVDPEIVKFGEESLADALVFSHYQRSYDVILKPVDIFTPTDEVELFISTEMKAEGS